MPALAFASLRALSWPALRRLGALGVVGVLGLPATMAQTQTSTPGLAADLERCRSLAEASERLKCYDMITLPARAAGGPAAAERTAAVSAGASTPGAQAPAAPGRPAAAQANVPVAASTARFGLEHELPAGAADELRSSIPGPFSGWEPKTRWKLANGQVWQVADGSRAYYRLASPNVRITRGALGSFFMEIDGVSHAVPVRRLE